MRLRRASSSGSQNQLNQCFITVSQHFQPSSKAFEPSKSQNKRTDYQNLTTSAEIFEKTQKANASRLQNSTLADTHAQYRASLFILYYIKITHMQIRVEARGRCRMDFFHFSICSPQVVFCCKNSQISFIFVTSQQIFASESENILAFFEQQGPRTKQQAPIYVKKYRISKTKIQIRSSISDEKLPEKAYAQELLRYFNYRSTFQKQLVESKWPK